MEELYTHNLNSHVHSDNKKLHLYSHRLGSDAALEKMEGRYRAVTSISLKKLRLIIMLRRMGNKGEAVALITTLQKGYVAHQRM